MLFSWLGEMQVRMDRVYGRVLCSASYNGGKLRYGNEQMQDHTFTLIVSAVGISGALAGIVIGHFLTRSSQHKQWLRDNRKEEFRELISAMSTSMVELTLYLSSQKIPPLEPMTAYLDSEKQVLRIIGDRIFISHDIMKLNVFERYTNASL